MKIYLRVCVIFFIIIILVSCSPKVEKSGSIVEQIKKEMDNININYGEIHHIEVVKDGLFVFYENQEQNEINTGFLRQTSKGWKWVAGRGGARLNPKEFSWHGSYSEEIPLTWLSGVITNPEIQQIITRKSDGTREKTAKVIKTQERVKIWFVYYEKPI